jgi:hypothetical protein
VAYTTGTFLHGGVQHQHENKIRIENRMHTNMTYHSTVRIINYYMLLCCPFPEYAREGKVLHKKGKYSSTYVIIRNDIG